MDRTERLEAIEELQRLKAKYFYYLDTKQWDSWLSLMAPDATMEWDEQPSTGGRDGKTGPKVAGVEELRKIVVEGILEPAQTVHHGHTPIIEVTSPAEARGIWAMEDIVVFADRTALRGYGHYHETYRKIHGNWKFASIHLKRLRVETVLG